MTEDELRALSLDDLNKVTLRSLHAKEVAPNGGYGNNYWKEANKEKLKEYAAKGGESFLEWFNNLDPESEEYKRWKASREKSGQMSKDWVKNNPEQYKAIQQKAIEATKLKAQAQKIDKYTKIYEMLPETPFTAKQLKEVQIKLGYSAIAYTKEMVQDNWLIIHYKGTNGSAKDVPLYVKNPDILQ